MLLDYKTLFQTFRSVLLKNGFGEPRAEWIARVFADSTFDGVFSHGINRFPHFIEDVRSGVVNANASPRLMNAQGALEQWDGQKGPGITNAFQCTDRSVDMALEHGIGCVGLRNTNHWMRGGTYGWRAAGKGFLFIAWTNTLPNMPPWGGKNAALGNNPLIFAIPNGEAPLVLDMAMSQFSYGTLEWHMREDRKLTTEGGYDRHDRLTRNPSEILDSGRILPAGLWKGSALSMVLDLAAAAISGGNTTVKIGALPVETELSQVFISVDISKTLGQQKVSELIRDTLAYIRTENGQARYPGQRALEKRKLHEANGVEIPNGLWSEVSGMLETG